MSSASSSLRAPRLATKMRALFSIALLVLSSCIGTTGSDIVSFKAFAAGPAEIAPDTGTRGLSFVSNGWSITLQRAKLHIGAVYLNRSVPVSGGQERACFLPGVYVAQVLGGIDVDALSPALQPFDEAGSGTADHAVTGEVWLTGARIDAQDDSTEIAYVEGTAIRGAESIRFEGSISIGRNRVVASTDPARPGANPLCAARIVTPIETSITPTNGGSLVVRVDPRGWFRNFDFGELEPVSATSDLRRIPDTMETGPAFDFYTGLHGSKGVYSFEWIP